MPIQRAKLKPRLSVSAPCVPLLMNSSTSPELPSEGRLALPSFVLIELLNPDTIAPTGVGQTLTLKIHSRVIRVHFHFLAVLPELSSAPLSLEITASQGITGGCRSESSLRAILSIVWAAITTAPVKPDRTKARTTTFMRLEPFPSRTYYALRMCHAERHLASLLIGLKVSRFSDRV
jgi:hypothetical protein